MKTATHLTALPTVLPRTRKSNFCGSYQRDENGIIIAHEMDDEFDEDFDDADLDKLVLQVYNEQYTILHDNFDRKTAENANYNWVSNDGSITTKIRTLNGYSVIETTFDEDQKKIISHVIKILKNNGDYKDGVAYLAGNSAVTGVAA